MTEKELQQQLDIKKWVESEKNCEDMCRLMPYCAYCDITAENPCAKAYNKMAEVEAAAADVKPAKKAPAKKPAAKKAPAKKETTEAPEKPAKKTAAKTAKK